MRSSRPDPNYVTDSPLRVRIETHRLYTEPPTDFFRWLLDRVSWEGSETVLDVGCGSGSYAEPVRERAARYLAGDISPGMLATESLQDETRLRIDVHDLPFANDRFEVVLANHMLYHVDDIGRALQEIRRVLCPGGVLLAGTNSTQAMAPLRMLPWHALRHLGIGAEWEQVPAVEQFSLENGADLIRPVFPNVTEQVLDAALVFPEVEPVVRYVRTLRDWLEPRLPEEVAWETMEASMRLVIAERIAEEGAFRVSKRTGVFVATKGSRSDLHQVSIP